MSSKLGIFFNSCKFNTSFLLDCVVDVIKGTKINNKSMKRKVVLEVFEKYIVCCIMYVIFGFVKKVIERVCYIDFFYFYDFQVLKEEKKNEQEAEKVEEEKFCIRTLSLYNLFCQRVFYNFIFNQYTRREIELTRFVNFRQERLCGQTNIYQSIS